MIEYWTIEVPADRYNCISTKENGVNIYVGNLSFKVTEDDLRREFGAYGEVVSASIIKDKFSGDSRGFAFVEMADQTQAEAAIQALNGKDMMGRTINVNEARPRTEGGGDRPRGPRRDRGPRREGGSRG